MIPFAFAEPVVAAEVAPGPAAEPRPNVVIPIFHAAGQFLLQRTAEAYFYPDPFAYSRVGEWGKHYRDAFTKPPLFDRHAPAFEWDHDRWTINVIGHGLMGSELYLRARQCALGVPLSFAFTAAASTVWEYAIEGNGVRPSAEDLVYTPLAGLVLGEGRFQLFRLASGLAAPGPRAVLKAVIDPFGELERALGTRC